MSKPKFTVDPAPMGEDPELTAWFIRQLQRVEDWWPKDLEDRLKAIEALAPGKTGTWPIVDFSRAFFTSGQARVIVEDVYILVFAVDSRSLSISSTLASLDQSSDATLPSTSTGIYENGLGSLLSKSADLVSISSDGINWSANVATGIFSGAGIQIVTYYNNLWYVVGNVTSTSGVKVVTSPDAAVWSEVFSDAATTSNGSRGAASGSTFVLPNYDSSTTTSRIKYSVDAGLNWSLSSVLTTSSQRRIGYVILANGKWFALGGRYHMWVSDDLITWNLVLTGSSSQFDALVDVKYGDGLYVAVTESTSNSKLYTSTDGSSWTDRGSFPSARVDSLLFDEVDKWSFVNGNDFLTSSDGITWANKAGTWSNLRQIVKLGRTASA